MTMILSEDPSIQSNSMRRTPSQKRKSRVAKTSSAGLNGQECPADDDDYQRKVASVSNQKELQNRYKSAEFRKQRREEKELIRRNAQEEARQLKENEELQRQRSLQMLEDMLTAPEGPPSNERQFRTKSMKRGRRRRAVGIKYSTVSELDFHSKKRPTWDFPVETSMPLKDESSQENENSISVSSFKSKLTSKSVDDILFNEKCSLNDNAFFLLDFKDNLKEDPKRKSLGNNKTILDNREDIDKDDDRAQETLYKKHQEDMENIGNLNDLRKNLHEETRKNSRYDNPLESTKGITNRKTEAIKPVNNILANGNNGLIENKINIKQVPRPSSKSKAVNYQAEENGGTSYPATKTVNLFPAGLKGKSQTTQSENESSAIPKLSINTIKNDKDLYIDNSDIDNDNDNDSIGDPAGLEIDEIIMLTNGDNKHSLTFLEEESMIENDDISMYILPKKPHLLRTTPSRMRKHRHGKPSLNSFARSVSLLRFILIFKPNLNKLNGSDHQTPLHKAMFWGRRKVVKFLLQEGADPWTKDAKGRTALIISASSHGIVDLRALNLLIQNLKPRTENESIRDVVKAYINETDNQGNTLLHYCCRFTLTSVFNFCLHYEADVNLKNDCLKTPLDLVSENPQVEMLRLFVKSYGGKSFVENNYSSIFGVGT